MALIFGWTLTGVVVLLCLHEAVQYRRAHANPDELPYPKRRLLRRLLIGLLFVIPLLLTTYFPSHGSVGLRLGLLLCIPLSLLAALVCWWRDLGETSRSVVAQAQKVDEGAGAELAGLMRQALEQQARRKPE